MELLSAEQVAQSILPRSQLSRRGQPGVNPMAAATIPAAIGLTDWNRTMPPVTPATSADHWAHRGMAISRAVANARVVASPAPAASRTPAIASRPSAFSPSRTVPTKRREPMMMIDAPTRPNCCSDCCCMRIRIGTLGHFLESGMPKSTLFSVGVGRSSGSRAKRRAASRWHARGRNCSRRSRKRRDPWLWGEGRETLTGNVRLST